MRLVGEETATATAMMSRNASSSANNAANKNVTNNDNKRIVLRSSPGHVTKSANVQTVKVPPNLANKQQQFHNNASLAHTLNNTQSSSLSHQNLQRQPHHQSEVNNVSKVDTQSLVLEKLNENNRLIHSLFERLENLEEKVDIILTRCVDSTVETELSQQEQQLGSTRVMVNMINTPSSVGQSKEFADRVRRELNLDLDMDLFYNSFDLLSVPFSSNNLNSYGTKLMDILFTRDELATHTIDPVRSELPSLDQNKINMIKEAFRTHWPFIRSSLKQKCLDTKRRKKMKDRLEAKKSELLMVDEDVKTEDPDEDEEYYIDYQ